MDININDLSDPQKRAALIREKVEIGQQATFTLKAEPAHDAFHVSQVVFTGTFLGHPCQNPEKAYTSVYTDTGRISVLAVQRERIGRYYAQDHRDSADLQPMVVILDTSKLLTVTALEQPAVAA